MAAGQGVSEQIDLADFTPGIFSDYIANGTRGQPAPDGAAQQQDTFRCYGAPSGGLRPLPRKRTTVTLEPRSDLTQPAGKEGERLLASYLVSPIVPQGAGRGSEVDFPFSGFPDQLFKILGAFGDAAAGTDYRRHARLLRSPIYDSSETQNVVEHSIQYENAFPAGTDLSIHENRMHYGYCGLEFTGTTTDGGDPNSAFSEPVLVWLMACTAGEFDDVQTTFGRGGTAGTWPDSTAGAVNDDSVEILHSMVNSAFLLSHQGRIVTVLSGMLNEEQQGISFGTTGIIQSADAFRFLGANNAYGGLEFNAIPVFEARSSYGAWATVNASEMFVVKHLGGGIVVRGDLANPTVLRLPGVASTYGAANIGVMTPLGFVYGTRYGVWTWNGGDVSTLLSPQLESWFWDTGLQDDWAINQTRGKFNFTHPWVMCPNNWVFDIRSQGWFRLEDPDVIQYSNYEVGVGAWHDFDATFGHAGYFYALPPRLISGSETVDFERYDIELGATSYSWRSQPLARTRGRRIDFRELMLMAQGNGTVTVELIAADGTVGSTTTFTVTNEDRPQPFQRGISFQGHDVEVRITSTGSAVPTPDAEAPSVYRLSIGFQEGPTV